MEDINKFENLNSFQTEIAAMKEAEEKAKAGGSPTTAHFLEWNGVEFYPSELTEDDKEIWEKYKNGILNMDGYRAYDEKLRSDPKKNNSRIQFGAFIANKAQEISLEEYFEKNNESRKKI
jgi:hypothetical protein